MEEMPLRNYQSKLVSIARKENSIIYLPTGSGKTYIAIWVLKELADDAFAKSYSDGGKISMVLVNTVQLVDQHSKSIKNCLPYEIGSYKGDMNVDLWDKDMWLNEFNKNKVLVMTAQILANLISTNIIELSKVNLLIFDECHRGVEAHCMRQIMQSFQGMRPHEKPRVLGLTATLLNGNVKETQVLDHVKNLETTFHAKVATADELTSVLRYSTDPHETIEVYDSPELLPVQVEVIQLIRRLKEKIMKVPRETVVQKHQKYKSLDAEQTYAKYTRLLDDLVYHVEMLGITGAVIAVIKMIIHLEYQKQACASPSVHNVISVIISELIMVKHKLHHTISNHQPNAAEKFCSSKVKKLLGILMDYKEKSNVPLLGIVFVQRRNTAEFLYHVIMELKKTMSNLDFIRPNFIIGFNANPLSSTREALYYSKMNKEVLNLFKTNEVNLLFASNVIEEGVDIQECKLVVKFDTVTNYREYIQSKGRARHSSSIYAMMVERKEKTKFEEQYSQYRRIENNLYSFLVGANDTRTGPTDAAILDMYNELPPYYVNGPGSAHITLQSAIPLLMLYCASLPSDSYTIFEPNWYLEKLEADVRVILELPIICAYRDAIVGPFRRSKKDAKRAVAFVACILLHRTGELNDNLIPVKMERVEHNIGYLFKHWPAISESDDGLTNKRRVYSKKVPAVIQNKILETAYLHIIQLEPNFLVNPDDRSTYVQHCMCTSNLSYGFISSNPLPAVCSFPLFLKSGQVNTSIDVNAAKLNLTLSQVKDIRRFHKMVFEDVLSLQKNFLIMGEHSKHLLVVPVTKNRKAINFDVITQYTKIYKQNVEMTAEEKLALHVTNESYLGKIVTPWYRQENKQYLVLEVCSNLNASSNFPNNTFDSYAEYFQEKYSLRTLNKRQPMLLVKALTSRQNCLKPRGLVTKRNKEDTFDDMELHLIPEFCVKQEFPATLWLQAMMLPSILHRTVQLLRAEELRNCIAQEAGLGQKVVESWEPLILDMSLIHYKSDALEEKHAKIIRKGDAVPKELDIAEALKTVNINKEFHDKVTNSRYPWHLEEEPVDINRHLDIQLLDIKYFVNFVHTSVVKEPTRTTIPCASPLRNAPLAINFERTFVPKKIKLIGTKLSKKGPELSHVYQALATAKCNDIVNLERLETLGDSFLKLYATLFIFLRFTEFKEGELTVLKSKLISNKNLFYLARQKGITEYIKMTDFDPRNEWLPPGFSVPSLLKRYVDQSVVNVSSFFNIRIPDEEKLSGEISTATTEEIMAQRTESKEEGEDTAFSSMCNYLGQHLVSDKTIADVIEALIGVYFMNSGIEGGLKFIEWLGLIPKEENIVHLIMHSTVPDPVLKRDLKPSELELLLPRHVLQKVESIMGYHFKNPAYLLQALTHPSYSTNRITYSYERLEFIGDAVLDFLITTYIYENDSNLSPGQLTDLRSALVNNEIFASYAVRLQLHMYMKHFNDVLYTQITKFAKYQERRNHVINDDTLILMNEADLKMAENIDCPKVLGDIFESMAGAIFLDSGMDLDTVWNVFYKIMWEEIDMFSKDIPRNPISVLSEMLAPSYPIFHKSMVIDDNKTMIKMDFMLNGTMTRVHGFGDNKKIAKKAAAKLALRLLGAKKFV